jgi:hypothetical protein
MVFKRVLGCLCTTDTGYFFYPCFNKGNKHSLVRSKNRVIYGMNIKIKVVVALALAVFVLPGVTFAQTRTQSIASLQAELNALIAEVQLLEAQLAAQGGTTTTTNTPTTIGTPSLTVTYPTGGEILDNGGKTNIATITWTTQNLGTSSVNIDLEDANNYTIRSIATNVPNTGSYAWLDDPTLASGSYKVVIYPVDLGPEPPEGVSGLFTVNTDVAPTPLITITQPVAGDGYIVNQPLPVYWNQNYVSNSVVVTLAKPVAGGADGIYVSQPITTVAQGNGFTIPASAISSAGQYYIQICDASVTPPAGQGSELCTDSDTFNVAAASQTLSGAGLTVSIDRNTPPAGTIVQNTTGNTLAVFDFTNTSNAEAIRVTKLNVIDADSSVNAVFSNVSLWVNSTQEGVAAAPVPTGAGTAYIYTFNAFPEALVVPQGGTIQITIKGDTGSTANGSITDGSVSRFEIATTADASNNTAAQAVVAYGTTSNAQAAVTLSSAIANPQTILRTILSVTGQSVASMPPAGFQQIGSVTLTANAAGNALVNNLKLTFGGNANTPAFLNSVQLKDSSGNDVVSVGHLAQAFVSGNGITWIFAPTSNPLVIPAGSSYTMTLWGDLSKLTAPAQGAQSVTATIQSSLDFSYYDGSNVSAIQVHVPANQLPITVANLSGSAVTPTTPTYIYVTGINSGETVNAGSILNFGCTVSPPGKFDVQEILVPQGNTPLKAAGNGSFYDSSWGGYSIGGFSPSASNPTLSNCAAFGAVTIPSDIPAGSYYLKLFLLPWGALNSGQDAPQYSNSNGGGVMFTVAAPAGSATAPSITMVSPNGGEQWQQGKTYQVVWQRTNFNDVVAINLIDYTPGSRYGMEYGITNGMNVVTTPGQTSFSWTIPTSIPAGNYYKVVVGSGSVNAFSSNYFSIVAAVASTPTPTVTLSAAATTIAVGALTNVTWKATNATACAPSGFGSVLFPATSGVVSFGANTAGTYNLSVTCTGNGGTSVPASVTITVTNPTVITPTAESINMTYPTAGVTLSNSGFKNNIATIQWTASNIPSGFGIALLNGAGTSIVKYLGPNAALPPSTTSYVWANDPTLPSGTYQIEVYSSEKGGGAQSLSGPFSVVTVVPATLNPAPTVTLSANPTTIIAGKETTISWSSTYATACTASGGSSSGNGVGWAGNANTGQTVVQQPSVTTTYTVTCTGAGGTSAPASVTVTVNPATVTVAQPVGTLIPSTTFVNFNVVQGQSNPSPVQIVLTNGSTVSVNLTLSMPNQPSWLNTGYNTQPMTLIAGGTMGVGASVDATQVSGPGTYTTNLIVTGNFTNSPITIPITLTVTAPPAPVISQVQGLTATASGNSVNLSWSPATASAGIGVYAFYRSTTSGFTPTTSNLVAEGNVLSYTDSGLAAGTYYYVVSAQDVNGTMGPASAQAQVTIAPTVVARPILPPTLPTLPLRALQSSASNPDDQTAIVVQSLQNVLSQLGALLKSL